MCACAHLRMLCHSKIIIAAPNRDVTNVVTECVTEQSLLQLPYRGYLRMLKSYWVQTRLSLYRLEWTVWVILLLFRDMIDHDFLVVYRRRYNRNKKFRLRRTSRFTLILGTFQILLAKNGDQSRNIERQNEFREDWKKLYTWQAAILSSHFSTDITIHIWKFMALWRFPFFS